jgi:exopolysaccharide biosynthesis polyprenyl glycosylphosphotransferase
MVRHKNLYRGLKVIDLLIMAGCFAFAEVFAMPQQDFASVSSFLSLQIKLSNFAILGGLAIVWHILFCAYGLYDDLLLASSYRKAKDVLKATSIGTCLIVAIAAVLDVNFVDARFMVVFWPTVSILSFGIRYVARKALVGYYGQEENRRRVLLVGVNSRSVKLARRIEVKNDPGCRAVGFVDDTDIHALNFHSSGYELVAKFSDLATYLASTEIDEVMICLPIKSRTDDAAIAVAICIEQGIAYSVVRDLFRLDVRKSTIRQLDDQLLITVHPHTISSGQAAIKRVFDVLLSTLLIVLLSPVFLISALLIKLTSSGPVIFVQERVGLNKKPIRILKFCTMVPNAEELMAELEQYNEAEAPAFKMKNDPRITPVGRFLRKSSIDELPQLLNVLFGHMSLVGPRPMSVRDYSGLNKDWYRRRVSIRPGLTGLWQVSGRDQSSFDEWMKLDIQYIDKWSLSLDLKLIMRTIPAVLKGTGAV